MPTQQPRTEPLDTTQLLHALTALKKGDFAARLPLDWTGVRGKIADALNDVLELHEKMARECARVSHAVGKEGKITQRLGLGPVDGSWITLVDSVNTLIEDLGRPSNEMARVMGAVANGDLSPRMALEVDGKPLEGQVLHTARTVNTMVEQLSSFASEVTRVVREVGVEGQLGGQASVPGAAGIWKDLTDNVNQLAANLTTQMRAIAEVATAVTKGDLSRSINVEASGEMAVLTDNINEMIRNLRDTTQKNSEQDWLKTNLAKFTRLLPGQKDLLSVARLILSELAPLVSAQHGIFYLMDNSNSAPRLRLLATYAYKERKGLTNEFALGEGLVGQCALEKERILITDVPSDYVQISSGLGHATPSSIMVLPVLFEGEVKAVIELASFQRFNAIHQAFLEQFTESIGIVLNTIEANVRTQELLKQSQSLARELQSQQEELQQTNQELQDKARLLAQQNAEVERKNSEVEQAKLALEEKAAQLALTSKYKSEFLANMSHELRTPLNSLLLLARQLSDNPNGNLLPKQVEFAHAIYASGMELLMLINDILDLAKIESGTVSLHMQGIALRDLCDDLERTFRPIADTKGLGFTITLDVHLPQYLQTDATRLLQILKNLLANAFKFTDKGQVALQVMLTTMGWSAHLDTLNNADRVVAFAVSDTGMGIPADQQRLIFEAFQQADGTTSRKYGGTGLGLSISREIAHLFGGEIRLHSATGQGSTFTFYLPQPALGAPSWSQLQRAGEQLDAALPAPSRTVWAPFTLRAQGEGIRDDREQIQPGDRVVLIVENDVNFAQVLLEIVREIAWKGIVTSQGASAGALARQFKPDAITLDLLLPDIEGWTVLELLQRDPDTRHIPVHVITVMDEERERGRQQGMTSYLVKPVSKQAVHEALAASMASDPQRPGPNGRSLSPGDTLLVGKKVLIVDDDVRNLFALTSILEAQHMEILVAENGQTGVDLLQNVADVAVVLMDIMLPDMDGYDTMRAIRSVQRLSHLPIIAVTAKAMPGDREKCLEAGASDYLAKPVDTEQLLARLRAAVAGR